MGVRISFGLMTACIGGALLASACGSVEGSGDEQVAQVGERSVFDSPEEHDSLAMYAARCDAATGIHVPAFSCNQGISGPSGNHFAWIDQKSGIDTVNNGDGLFSVGTSTGTRTPDVPATTLKRMTSTGANISGTSDNFQFANLPMNNAVGEIGGVFGGQAEVKIVSYESSLGTNAIAGLMARTTDQTNPGSYPNPLNADSPHAFIGISPAGNVHFRYRGSRGGPTTTPPVLFGQGFPIWLRLSWQVGVGIKAEISKDHNPATWQTVGLAPVYPEGALPPALNVGVAVASATVNYDRFFTTKHCDTPSGLGDSCDLKSTFQVLARTADAIAVANCRNQGAITDGQYQDIAVLQYNRKNGALCFYQAPPTSGLSVSAPSDPNGTFPWMSPEVTHSGNCTGCHDTGGLIRSPYLKQTGLLPGWGEGYNNNGVNPLSYVGHDFENDRSYWVSANNAPGDTGGNCGGCHGMAVNNVSNGGTSMRFAYQATSEFQTTEGQFFSAHKNPPSATSRLWMRPTSTGPDAVYPDHYDPLAAATAYNFRQCGAFLGAVNYETDPALWPIQPDDPEWGCSFGPNGMPYSSPVQILEDTQWGNGGSSTGTLDSVTITSGDHTDIYGTSDTGVFAHTLVAPGDGIAMVKVTSLKNTNEYAKAGIMWRQDSPANAQNVMIAVTPQHGVTFQYRPTAGAATPAPAFLGTMTAPVWLRLDRTGETFVGLVSTDNRATWQQVGQAVTLPGFNGSRVGLVNTAHSTATQTGEAKFEAFDFTSGFGWSGSDDRHVLIDARVGSEAGSRSEWTTREYMTANGGDIQGTADDFLYSFKTFSGNGELITTVESLTSTAAWGKAGIMIRDNAIDTAKNVFIGKTPSGVTFQYRDANGGGTTATNVNTANVPMAFRLVRNGNTISGYYRAQGAANWISLGSRPFSSFNANALMGLAVSSQNQGARTDAVFNSDVKFEPPGFLWPDLVPDNNPPTPPSGTRPCDGICTGATTFTFGNNYQSGQLGTGAVCLETTHAVVGGNCSNVQSPRTFNLNGVTEVCNGVNWSSVPAARNGGYCVSLPAGQRQDAAFTVF